MTEPDPPFDQDLRALLQRGARVGAAPEEVRLRVLDRVEAIVGPPGGGGGSSGAQGSPEPPAVAPTSGLLGRLLPLAAAFTMGGGIALLATRTTVPSPSSVEPPRIVDPDRLAAADSAPAPPPDPPARALNERPAPPVAANGSAPSNASRDQLNAERALLDVARGAIERGESRAAMDAATKHERTFPNGILMQEREAMAIRALVMLGRTADARERAARFRQRFPHSVLLPTIESTVGASPAP